MKTSLKILGIAVALTAANAAQATLILNGGFENVTDTTASDWTQFGNAYAENRSAMTGANGLTLYGNWTDDPNYSGAYQTFSATAGQQFLATAYAFTSSGDQIGVGNTAYLKLEFFDASLIGLGWFNASNPVTHTTPVNTWFLQTVNATAPTGAAFVRETLIFEQNAGAGGSVFFDNATLDVVPEPSVLVMLLIGGLVVVAGRRHWNKHHEVHS